jgi:hypothetical protein
MQRRAGLSLLLPCELPPGWVPIKNFALKIGEKQLRSSSGVSGE